MLLLSTSSARADSDSAGSSPSTAPADVVPGPSEDGANEPDGYNDAVESGLKEHARGNYQEARAHFQRAHALFPNARTLRGLGKVEYELRNYGEAARALADALASDVRPLDDDLRAETSKLLERARNYVGEVHVAVDPGSATVSVDGVTVATGPKASLSLLVGDHILEFRAQGRLSERRSVRIQGGERTVVQVVLAPPQGLEEPPGGRRIEPKPLRSQWWVWTGAGVLAAALAVGLAVGTSQSRDHRPVEAGSSGVVLRNP